jgi:MFS family permease
MKDRGMSSRGSGLPVLGPIVRFFRGKAAGADVAGALPPSEIRTYRCGTLTYTRAGLVTIFAWLLWGDFCLTLMESVVPSILPLKLKALASPNWLTGLIMTTIPGILSMTVCPAISFRSDRYRSKWGRRIPFIVWTLPFLCLSLVLLGCSEDISAYLQTHLVFLRNVAPATVTIALIGLFMAAFQFFNMFVNSVFWYLFNDVVPAQHMGRFTGSFRIVGLLAASLYNGFIFGHAGTNMREIMIGAALLYFFGFALMCWRVKEGEYPPVTAAEDRASRGFRGVKTFLKESFCHKWYWLFFLWNTIGTLANGVYIFHVFFLQEMGLSLDHIGKLVAVGGVAGMAATSLAAVFVDRWHPMRVQIYLCIFAPLATLSCWVWIFVTLPGKHFFWLSMGSTLIAAFSYGLSGVCYSPLQMRIFPKSRYGQFCSAQQLVRSLFSIVSGVVAGLFIDGMAWLCHERGYGPGFVYRFNFVWAGLILVVMAILGIWVYVYWHRLGADDYESPAPWSPDKVEARDVVRAIGPQSGWLSLSLRLFDAIMGLSVLGLLPMMWWMHQRGAATAFGWYALLVLPCSLAVWLAWKLLERGIRRDMARSLANQTLHNGIPHHGVLMVVSIQYLLALGIWVAQVIVTVRLNMERECIVFGIAAVLMNLLLIAAVLAIWRMERGRSVTLAPATRL